MTRDEMIKQLYKGDVELYNDVMRKTDEWAKTQDPARNMALSWQTVQQASSQYPEYEQKSLKVIENFLNYLPAPQIYIPHQPFIKALIASHHRGEMTEAKLIPELEFHCKRIRNDDMKKYGWAKQGPYEQADYDLYNTHLAVYKQKARDRLIVVINNVPALEYSLGAEIFLRNVFVDDDYHDEQPFGIYEYRAATIGIYREAMLEKGPEAADDSMLFGIFICKHINVSPYSSRKIIE